MVVLVPIGDAILIRIPISYRFPGPATLYFKAKYEAEKGPDKDNKSQPGEAGTKLNIDD